MKVVRLILRAVPVGFATAIALGILGGASASALLYAITEGLRAPTVALGLLFAVLCVARAGLELASHSVLALLTGRVVGDLRLRIARAAVSVPYADLEGIGLERVRVAMTDDAETVGAAGGTIVTATTACAAVVGGFAYLVWLSWPAALGAAALFALAFFVSRRFATTASSIIEGNHIFRVKLQRSFGAVVRGAKELKLHSLRRSSVLDENTASLRRVHGTHLRGVSYLLASEAIGQTAVFLALAAAIAVLAIIHADAGAITGVVLATIFVQAPLFTLLGASSQLTEANVSAVQLERLIGQLGRSEVTTHESAAPRTSFGHLALRGVAFVYPSEKADTAFSVGPVDLDVRPGEIVFIIGGNGSGKSTLAKLLVGLYVPSEGQIRVDGEAVVSEEEREAYRQLFAVVFAEGHVFQELWGASLDSVDETANTLLADLQLDHKVRVTGGRFSTTELSQGQRKRLSLVAAYLEARPILVFDEWAADQDPEFKRVFYTRFLPALKRAGKAVLVISHDDHYFSVADRVLRMERGRVIALEESREVVS